MSSQIWKGLATVVMLAAFIALALGIEILRFNRPVLFGRLCRTAVVAGALALMLLSLHLAHARDLGQWEAGDPVIAEWYRSLMRPDAPESSCCGEADAYYVDIKVRGGKTYAVIADDRPDEPRGRPHRDVGETFEVPDEKLKWDRKNPTGRDIIFLSRVGYVFCLVQGTGI